MLNKVTEWKMSEEERQAYIAKYPIKPSGPKKRREKAFDNVGTDYKWRGERGNASRWGN